MHCNSRQMFCGWDQLQYRKWLAVCSVTLILFPKCNKCDNTVVVQDPGGSGEAEGNTVCVQEGTESPEPCQTTVHNCQSWDPR
jgi:hypothetical protein